MFKILLKRLLVVLLFVSATGLLAQNQILTVGESNKMQNEALLLSQNDNATIIRFNLNELELVEVETDYGVAFMATSEKAPAILEAGSPDVFYLTSSFIIPDKGSSELEISYGAFTEFENVEIIPSKGHILRSVDPETIPYVKGEVYSQNKFYPETPARLREPFIMRDVRGQSLDVFPVQYNPVTKILRVYSEITVTVNYTENEGVNEFTTQKRHATIEPQFHQMYGSMFLNYSVIAGRGYPTEEEGEILIICHPAFMDAMQPYVDWKRTIGRKTTMVSTTETGTTTTAIKSYVQNYYNNPDNNLTYILLVGDHAQIPTHTYNSQVSGGGPNPAGTDHYYGQLVGSDPYIEVFVGRFSAENVAHVETQVQRSIWYERDITTADTWIGKAIGLAANEGGSYGQGHDGPEADYVHMNKIRTRLLDYGYDPVYQEYNGNCPGVPNTSISQISSRFNTGVGIANYCNHGMQNAWYLMGLQYTSTHVGQLQNAGMLPYIFSVACVNGRFMFGDCFAEAWLRATQNNQPTGAVAVLMATLNLWWNPPMTAQDAFINICLDLPPYYPSQPTPGIKRTFAGAAINATMLMMNIHGSNNNSQSKEDFESWLVFGDPSLMFRTKTPQEMTISHQSSATMPFIVNCDADGALAALTYVDDNDEVIILGTAVVDNGTAVITFDASGLTPFMDLTLAVTGFNKVTYLTTVSFEGGNPELPEPLNLTYIVEKANHVVLSWDAPEGGKSLTVTGYNVYRDGELINPELVRDILTYTDVVPHNGEYKYKVTALYDEAGTMESGPSNTVTVAIDGMCIPIGNDIVVEQENKTYNILVSWEKPEYEGTELAGYNVYRDTEQINTEILPATELSYIDKDLEPETTYCYQIEVVYNDCAEPLISNEECLTVQPNVSINESDRTQTFQIFPNPTDGKLIIENGEFKIENVDVYDVFSRNVLSHQLSIFNFQLSTQIDISDLPAGVYFVRIKTENGEVVTKKMVKN